IFIFSLALLAFTLLFIVNRFLSDRETTTQTTDEYPLLTSDKNLTGEEQDQLNIDVRLLLAEKCYKCHNSTKHKAALILDTRDGIFEGGENGPVITPGHSDQSEMIRRVTLSSRNEDAMPPEGDRLTREEVALLSLWIDEGAHWADTTLKLFREAPLTLNKPELPSSSRIDNPIDIWVNKYFEDQNIKWPVTIDDRSFIRKVYLDIIGRLPSGKITLDFTRNADPDKYQKVVDQLLSDPQNYTVHWLSYWNDLLRNDYTGTGFITGGRKQITEWLFQALFENQPYREMVRNLVNPDSLSEGFIKGIQWRGVVNASQRTELQAAQNVSQSLLGINLKCASCHNSFVNNVQLDQAYAFANVFADSSLEVFQCDKPTGRYTNTAFLYPELGPITGDSVNDRLSSLSDIMTASKNGRLYRTIVNRYWDRLMGRGLIATVDDMDQIPWNQDLLDWLAADFIEKNTDLKYLIKLITTSKTYRLQPVDLSPEEINKHDFIFHGPLLRRITAEQFMDAFTDFIYPFYSGVHFTQDAPEGNPEWIWHREIELDREVLPKPGIRYFRKKFNLEKINEISQVQIIVTADSSFQLFLNDQKICSGNDLRTINKLKIDKALIKNKNCLSIQARNDGKIANPAGILLTLKISYEDHDEFIVSDKSWITTNAEPEENWHLFNYLDTSWVRAKSYGKIGFWGHFVDFHFDHQDRQDARAALHAADPLSLALGRPTRENVTTKRSDESTLLQAMMLSNDELLSENIRRGAMVIKNNPGEFNEKIDHLFLNLLGRPVEKKELELFQEFTSQSQEYLWEDIIWSIIMLPEFHLI
ncbi:MAG: DUF1553 domain-containing protein, partial [Saprospiraceae bacterium]|nr:DUF1553 domain-containing protein [Saprospiraceae bacterium]